MSERRAAAVRTEKDRPLVLWGLGFVVAGIAIATAMAWPIYQSPRLAVVAAVAAVLAVALVLGGRALRIRPWRLVLASAVVYLLVVVPLAVPSALGSPLRILRGVRDGVVGIVVGWKQLLTLSLPLGEYQAVLVPFLVVVFVGTIVALTLAISPSKYSALAAPVVIAMSVFGPVFGSSETGEALRVAGIGIPAPREVLLGTLLVLVTLLWLVGRARLVRAKALRIARAQTGGVRQRRESVGGSVRRNALGATLVIVAVVGGLAFAPIAAGLAPRQAIRDGVDPLLVLRAQTSPLSSYRSSFEGARYDAELFTVEGAGDLDRLRLATLDSYDGEEFHVSGARSEPGRFTRLPRAATGGDELTITIGEGYSGIWTPVPVGLDAAPTFTSARAEELTDGFFVSSESSSAIMVAGAATGGASTGDASTGSATVGLRGGDSYRVSLPAAETTEAPVEALGTANALEPLVADEAYPALEDWVELQELPRTGAGLVDAITRLTDRGYLSHSLVESEGSAPWIAGLSALAPYAFQSSYSGHSGARVEEVFTTLAEQQRRAGENATDELLVSAVGDDEQFAVAGALLARYWGFDSRVVVGVRLAGDSADPALGVPPCDEVCTGANLTAWIEVLGAADTWVPIDTTPQFATAPTVIAEGEQLPQNPTIPEEVRSDLLDPPPAQRDDSDAAANTADDEEDWTSAFLPVLRIVGLTLLTLLLLVLPALVIGIAKSVRRRGRRDAKVPEVGIVGAWAELVDSYVDHGIPVNLSGTRSDLAEASGRPAAVALATRVDNAVFAEHPPGRAAREETWQLVDSERRDLAATGTVVSRMRAALTPASFLASLGSGSALARALSSFRRKDPNR